MPWLDIKIMIKGNKQRICKTFQEMLRVHVTLFLIALLRNGSRSEGCYTAYNHSVFTGVIMSPNFPSSYDNVECRIWIISAPAGKYIGLTFTKFSLESSFDFVEVRNGENSTSPLIGKFTGSNLPPARYSAEGSLYVKFTSDGSITHQGFHAKIEALWPGDFQPIAGHPLACAFEQSLCSWSQSTADNFDWSLGKGETLSSDTGPWADHTTGSGYYIYIETSSPRNSGEKAKLVYNSFSGSVCLRFYRHMFGASISELNIYVGGNRVYHQTGNKGDSWILDQVMINAQDQKIEIEAVRGTDYTGDISLDDFIVTRKCFPECFGIPTILSRSLGTVHSPNFPLNYEKNLYCVWRITVSGGTSVTLTFDTFNMTNSCNEDFIEIRDGTGRNSRFLGKYCNNQSIPVVPSTFSGEMQVAFFTGRSATSMGFQATFRETVIKGCSSDPLHISGLSGFITSPSFPSKYGTNQRCVWIISVPSGMHVRLTFSTFQLRQQPNCTTFVELRNGLYQNSHLLGRYCGTYLPASQYASSGKMRVTFISDSGPTSHGYNASYYAVPVPGKPYQQNSSDKSITIAWSWKMQYEAQFMVEIQLSKQNLWASAKCLSSLSANECVVNSPQAVVMRLKPYRSYRFRIQAKVLGEWNKFYVSSGLFWTHMAEPSRPPKKVQARSTRPTSINVLWKQIPHDFINGILLGYLVICTSRGLRSTSKTVSANSTYLEFTGLQRKTLYSIHVLGYTASGNGPASKTVYVKTQMEEPPVISKMSDTIVASWIGHQVSLGCYATGHNPIKYFWTRNNDAINGSHTTINHDSVLIVFPWNKDAFGTYTCTVSNRDGITTHNVTLIRIENPTADVFQESSSRSDSEQEGVDWKLVLSIPLCSLILLLVVVIIVLSRRSRKKQKDVSHQGLDNISLRNVDPTQDRDITAGNNGELRNSRYTGMPSAGNNTNRQNANYNSRPNSANNVNKGIASHECCIDEQNYQSLQMSTMEGLYEEVVDNRRNRKQKLQGLDDKLYENVA